MDRDEKLITQRRSTWTQKEDYYEFIVFLSFRLKVMSKIDWLTFHIYIYNILDDIGINISRKR